MMRKQEEIRVKKEEEELAEKQRLEEEKQAAAAPAKKGQPAKKGGAVDRTGSRGGVSSAASGMSRKRNVIAELMKKNKLTSQDDGDKKFNFKSFERVMTQMEGASTNIGGILAAMVF